MNQTTLKPIPERSEHQVSQLVARQKDYFNQQHTKSIAFRITQLQRLKHGIKQYEQKIIQALHQDLHKSEFEAYTTEIGILYEEINFTLKHLKKWARPKRVKTSLTHIGSKGKVIPEPYGTVLIIAPWNYPFQLALSPLVGAIAAGNTAIVKPSELTPHISHIMTELLSELYPETYIAVIEGGVQTSQHLLSQDVDYIFFTGSVGVGKLVMEAASRRLTPVTLELGGKSPCIVHEDADIELAAKRIVFGKFTNAGQTCIAPDYLFVHHTIKDRLIAAMKDVLHTFYGEHPLQHPDYGKIVNERHFNRLAAYVKDGAPILGGEMDRSTLKMEPTLLDQVTWDQPVMQEEIFGPVFPVLTYERIEDVVTAVNARPKPLALYLFTTSSAVEETITDRISFGGGCINDTLMHIATPHLPFGGVGESGIGSYHGESSFETFSHYKSMLRQTNKFDFSFRYPSAKHGLKIIRWLLK
ncbi:aldehyde dehydrogenase [Marinicrinis sediminis]|uniref:Aldehyde dehydrogenase n=1 Tax=Marinicrinis sediminis TaxID=1652465 RepID=A0ABW5R9Z3_9BACL